MTRTVIPIRNMHCRSCELRIEQELTAVPGVHRARVSHKRGEAAIDHDGPLDIEAVEEAVARAGYEVGQREGRQWLTRHPREYVQLAAGGLMVVVLLWVADRTGLSSLTTNGSQTSGLATALLIGLTAGISTCMALIGGLVLGMAARHAKKHPEATAGEKFRPHVFFNMGRIAGFFVLGGLLGTLGSALSPSPLVIGLLTIAVALVMLLLGIQLTEISPKLQSMRLTLPASIARAIGIHRSHEREYSHKRAFTLGIATFFLPCGFTQMMQLTAVATGNFAAGGLLMAAFAAGTTPGLLGIGGLTSVLTGLPAKLFFKTAGLLVIVLAVFNLQNGYRLTGWAAPWESPRQSSLTLFNVTMENGIQVARMEQRIDGYDPSTFVVYRGIPVRWEIDGRQANTCSSGIVVPTLKINQYLRFGRNVIEFTPQKNGVVRFTCSMGMFPGSFTVINPPNA